MVGLQTLDLAIGVRVPASQPNKFPSRYGRRFVTWTINLPLRQLIGSKSARQFIGGISDKCCDPA